MNVFVNTRPTNKATPTLPAMTSVHLPLLELMPFDTLHADEQHTLMCFIRGDINTLVVVSVEAVKVALVHLARLGVHHASDLPHRPTVIAVGEPTKKALTDFGFEVITPAERGLPMSNEGMIQLDELARLDEHDTVMIWRGEGGRRLLSDTLILRGVTVLPIAFYVRQPPPNLHCLFESFYLTTPKDAHLFVLVSSQMGFEAWQAFDRQHHATTYLALGERLTTLVTQNRPHATVRCLDDLHPDTIFDTLKSLTHEQHAQSR